MVSDPYHLPRWWPRTQRVENVSEGGGTEGRKWTQVLETKDGRGDPRRLPLRRRRHRQALRLRAADVEGTPFEKFLQSARTEIRLEPEGQGTEVTLETRQSLQGPLAARRVHDAPRHAAGPWARRSTAWSGPTRAGGPTRRRPSDLRRDGPQRRTGAFKWWGWGAAAKREAVPEHAQARAARRARRGAGRRRRAGRRSRTCRCPRRAPIPDAVRAAAGDGAADRRRGPRSAAPPAAAIPTWSGSARASSSWPPTPSRRRHRPSRSPRCSPPAPRRASPSCPFGGGSSVVGGLDAVAGSHSAVLSLDLAGLRAVEIDRTSLTARLGPGLRGPEAEGALSALGTTLGHFPQSYEQATIGGYAATRSAGQASTGYGRFDELVTAIELTTPVGLDAHAPDPAHRRRAASCASWCWAPRGRSA